MNNKISAIVLAAGNSSRMGDCKFLLLMGNGLSFIENIVQTFIDFGIKNTVIVTQERYSNVVEKLFCNNEFKPEIVINEFPERERFYSTQLGVKSLRDCDFCFIHNADSPFLDVETLDLLEMNKLNADYLCPINNGIGGHPILVNKKTLQLISHCSFNSILKDVLRSQKRMNIEVQNKMIAIDIDTKEDYKKYFN